MHFLPTAFVYAFLSTGSDHVTKNVSFSRRLVTRSTSALHAKRAGKSKRKKAASGGGFGVTTKTIEEEKAPDDYAVFPRLEASVQETLVPSAPHAAGQLPNEIYHRLDQIYGFGNFNFETEVSESAASEKESSGMSLSDMLMVSDQDDEPSSAKDLLNPSSDESSSASSLSGLQMHTDQLAPFDKFRVLNVDPLVLSVDDFFTAKECDQYIAKADSNKKAMKSRSPTVGKDAAAKAQRTSTTWYHHYKNVPELMAKACRLFGLSDINRFEEPQTVRYRRNEKFTWHLDALGPDESLPDLGGQRIATLLVYLSDLTDEEGGATMFRDLGGGSEERQQPLRVQPRKGSALLFFPAAGGVPSTPFDIRTLHCGEVVAADASQDKWISQLWLRQGTYAPTAPPGNLHAAATEAIADYCSNFNQ